MERFDCDKKLGAKKSCETVPKSDELTNLKAGGMPGEVWRDSEYELVVYG